MKIYPSRKSGFGRLGCFFVIVIIALFWAGGQYLYVALSNRQPTVMSYDDYAKTKPKAGWLVLTNCMLNLPGASYKSYGGKNPTELFVPVRSAESEDKKVCVLVATRDPQMLATFSEMESLSGGDAAITAWLLKNHQRVFIHRNVKGLVRFGIDMKDKDRSELKKLQENMDDDFIVLDENKEPSLLAGVGCLVGAFMLVGIGILVQKQKREPSTEEI